VTSAPTGGSGQSRQGDQSGPSVQAIAFSPNGSELATGYSTGKTYLWSTATGRISKVLTDAATGVIYTDGVNSVAYSPDGGKIATAYQNGFTFVWNAGGEQAYPPLEDPQTNDGVRAVTFSPNGQFLATADHNGSVDIWNSATGSFLEMVRNPDGQPITSIAFSPDSAFFATADSGAVSLWSTFSLSNPSVQPSQLTLPDGFAINAIAFSDDSEFLAIADNGGHTYLWSTSRRLVRRVSDRRSKGVLSVAFTWDGKILATADGNGSTYLWDIASGRPAGVLPNPNSRGVDAVTFSPDGKTLAAGDVNGSTYLWSMTRAGSWSGPPRQLTA
jgi:WD40 repeat protein